MVDDHDLAGLDPYDLMAEEGARLDRHFSSLRDADWARPSRCEGWSVRDVLAHLAATEGYNRACLDGTVQQFMGEMGAKGATDLATANDLGIRAYDGKSPSEILAAWRAESARHREEFRARDGGDVDSSVGAYPARWQAFHLAFELATHAGDVYVPESATEAQHRNDWQARFGRFALKEAKPDVTVDGKGDATHVRAGDVDVELPNAAFVEALAARAPKGTIDEKVAAALSITP